MGSSPGNGLLCKNRVSLRTIHQKWWDPFPDPACAGALVHRASLLGPYGVDEFTLLKSQQYIMAILIAGWF